MECIKNVKISAIFKSDKPVLSFFDIAETRKVSCKQKRNIIVIKDFYTITIFQKPKNKYHINVTKIKSLTCINKVIDWLIHTYCNTHCFQLVTYKIDNITASFDFKQYICLQYLANTIKNSRYNPERFHALYIKTSNGTAIIFQSGKINILGCSSLESVSSLWTSVQKKINAALTM